MVNKLLPSLLLQWGEGGSGLGGPSHLPCPYSLAGGVGGGGRDSGRGLTPLLPHPTPTPRSPGSPGALRRAESRSGGGGVSEVGAGTGCLGPGSLSGEPGGAPALPRADVPGDVGAVPRALASLPRSQPPPAGGSPGLGTGHRDPARPARDRASAVQRQRGPRRCLATGRPDLKGPGRRGPAPRAGRCLPPVGARPGSEHARWGGHSGRRRPAGDGSSIGRGLSPAGKGRESARPPHPPRAYYGGSG